VLIVCACSIRMCCYRPKSLWYYCWQLLRWLTIPFQGRRRSLGNSHGHSCLFPEYGQHTLIGNVSQSNAIPIEIVNALSLPVIRVLYYTTYS
jgi:hypothetical protein